MAYNFFLHWLGGIPKQDVNWLQYAIISTWEIIKNYTQRTFQYFELEKILKALGSFGTL